MIHNSNLFVTDPKMLLHPSHLLYLLKSHIDAYSKKNGTFVQAHEDSRTAAKVDPPKKLSGKMKELHGARMHVASELDVRINTIPDLYKPRSQVGGNVSACVIDDGAIEFLGIQKDKLAHLVMSMIADYGGGEKFKVSVSKSLAVKFTGKNGTVIERNIYQSASGGYSSKHKLFKAGKTGSGSAKDVMRCSLGVYHALGVKSISMFANLEVGGYAWARFGVLPANWIETRKTILSNLDAMQNGSHRYVAKDADGSSHEVKVSSISIDQEKILRALLASDDPKTLWAVADMKLGDRSIGRDILLGSGWEGAMALDDPMARSRLDNYIASGGKK